MLQSSEFCSIWVVVLKVAVVMNFHSHFEAGHWSFWTVFLHTNFLGFVVKATTISVWHHLRNKSLQCRTSILRHLFSNFILAKKSTFAVLSRSDRNMLRIRYIQRRRLKVPASYSSPVNHVACAKDTASDTSTAWSRPLPQRVPRKRVESW